MTVRYFNTVGAINPKDHYFLPHRLNWKELEGFIEKKYYFVLHAPRQSGKTTAIKEFVQHLNATQKYVALYLSVESAHYALNDNLRTTRILLEYCKDQISYFLPQEQEAISYLEKVLSQKELSENSIYYFLSFWAEETAKKNLPLALFFDEFDGLVGESLIALLKQFRTGYIDRPKPFPQTICLVGVRDLRDYKIKTKTQEDLGVLYSPFNVKSDSVTLPNFTEEDIRSLYLQHTEETGQVFTDEAIEYAFRQTRGQPWLVNALAYEACFRDVQDRSKEISLEVLQRAKETLIKRCDTHIDALLDRLLEPRVRTIVDAIISGSKEIASFPMEDVQYVRDLGLLASDSYEIANPIYKEVIPRALVASLQDRIPQTMPFYINQEGLLCMDKLLEAFTRFFRENSGAWLKGFAYHESAPHLLLMAFLQRLINGQGTVTREYALDSEKVDLFVTWKTQRFVLELKILYSPKIITDGLHQVASYMDKSGAEGHLIIFDRNLTKSWEEKIYHRIDKVEGKAVQVWGL